MHICKRPLSAERPGRRVCSDEKYDLMMRCAVAYFLDWVETLLLDGQEAMSSVLSAYLIISDLSLRNEMLLTTFHWAARELERGSRGPGVCT